MIATLPRKTGWKVYFGLSCILTLAGVPMQPPTWIDGFGQLISVVGLVGLFGYAWSISLPGTGRVWRGIALTTAAWLVVGLGVMVFRSTSSGVHHSVVTIASAAAIVVAVFAPTTVALFRYADWKVARSADIA